MHLQQFWKQIDCNERKKRYTVLMLFRQSSTKKKNQREQWNDWNGAQFTQNTNLYKINELIIKHDYQELGVSVCTCIWSHAIHLSQATEIALSYSITTTKKKYRHRDRIFFFLWLWYGNIHTRLRVLITNSWRKYTRKSPCELLRHI